MFDGQQFAFRVYSIHLEAITSPGFQKVAQSDGLLSRSQNADFNQHGFSALLAHFVLGAPAELM